MRTLIVPEGPIKMCQIWLSLNERLVPKKVVKKIPKIGYIMKNQSLKNLCQFIIRKKLMIPWKIRVIVLSNKKYEIIEHKEMKKLVVWINLFFTTDIDKHVRPKDRKE